MNPLLDEFLTTMSFSKYLLIFITMYQRLARCLRVIQWSTNKHSSYCYGAYNLADMTENKQRTLYVQIQPGCFVIEHPGNEWWLTTLTRWSRKLSEAVIFPLSNKGWERDSQEENQGEGSVPAKWIRLYKERARLFEGQNGQFCWHGVIIKFMWCQLDWATACPD